MVRMRPTACIDLIFVFMRLDTEHGATIVAWHSLSVVELKYYTLRWEVGRVFSGHSRNENGKGALDSLSGRHKAGLAERGKFPKCAEVFHFLVARFGKVRICDPTNDSEECHESDTHVEGFVVCHCLSILHDFGCGRVLIYFLSSEEKPLSDPIQAASPRGRGVSTPGGISIAGERFRSRCSS